MKKLMIAMAVLVVSAGVAGAQDVTAGATSYKKCAACHDVGPTAKNKVGPVLNGLDGRKSGTVAGYNYSDANKSSGITWNEAVLPGLHQGSQGQDPEHQDGVRRHQERDRGEEFVGLPQAVRRRRQDQVTRRSEPQAVCAADGFQPTVPSTGGEIHRRSRSSWSVAHITVPAKRGSRVSISLAEAA